MAGSTFRSAVRRALTFWRRSIQARVVASTVVLSAVVVTAVGWVLLQQTQQGLLDHRVDAVLAEVDTAMADANEQLDGALHHRQRPRRAAARCWSTCSSAARPARGLQVVLIGAGRRRRRTDRARARRS